MSKQPVNKILVLDDDGEFRKLITQYLKELYSEIEIDEYDPSIGLPPFSFPWTSYDILILDYDLGNGENGLEWLRQFKTSSNFPATIILTSETNQKIVVKAIRYGVQSFLHKEAINPEKLKNAIIHAIEKNKKDSAQIENQKIRTHSYNKEKFISSLENIGKNNSLYLVAIDKFQLIQEKIGIFGINSFSVFISETLSEYLEKTGIKANIAKISDSTTALLIEDTASPEIAEERASSLCEFFDGIKYEHEDEKIDFYINVGVFFIKDDNTAVNTILSKLEAACRKARDTRGNSFIINPSGEQTESNAGTASDIDKEAKQKITAAIKEERIQALFQAMVNVSDTSLFGNRQLYQVRANLRDEDNNIIEAKDFLPILKNTKSQNVLDRWIIRDCIVMYSKLQKQSDEKYSFFIKLSGESLNDDELSDWTGKIIKLMKIPDPAGLIILEIEAADFLADPRKVKLQLNKLRVKLKASIAISEIQDIDQLNTCIQQDKFDFIMFSPEHIDSKKMEIDEIEKIANICQGEKIVSVATKIDSGEYLAQAASAGIDYIIGHFVQPQMENIVATETVEVKEY